MASELERRWWRRAAALQVLATVYVLSMGPAWWLADRLECWDIAWAAFAPLLLLMNYSEPFANALVWYLRFWADLPT